MAVMADSPPRAFPQFAWDSDQPDSEEGAPQTYSGDAALISLFKQLLPRLQEKITDHVTQELIELCNRTRVVEDKVDEMVIKVNRQ